LAQHIDSQEGQDIRARGRAVFRRHHTVREMVSKLRNRRLELGLSLADVAARTGIAKPNLSRLENNPRTSPTLESLHRYATALGMKVRVELVHKN
jgi:predicted transcriptional regulator